MKVTKKDIEQLTELISKYGYWSKEVRIFNDNYMDKKGYVLLCRLENKVKINLKHK